MIASCKDLSASSMNCSLPPRKMMVVVRAFSHPVNEKKLGHCQLRGVPSVNTLNGDSLRQIKARSGLLLNFPVYITCEHVVSVSSDLSLLKAAACTQNRWDKVVYCCLDGSSSGPADTSKILGKG